MTICFVALKNTPKLTFGITVMIGVMSGTSGGLYWLGYHLDFSANSSKDSRGQSLALMRTTTILANAAGPLIGGLVAQWYVLAKIRYFLIWQYDIQTSPTFVGLVQSFKI